MAIAKKQIKLTESNILEAIDDILTDYAKNGVTVDVPTFYGYDYSKHTDNPSKEQKGVDNEWSREHAFNSCRNYGAGYDDDIFDYIESMPGVLGYDEFYIKEPNAYGFPDRNDNVDDYHRGRYGMLAQGDDNDEDTKYARTKRPTRTQTLAAMDEFEDSNELNETEDNQSLYDEYLKFKYAYRPEETPDYNTNVLDFNTGRYSMLAQSEDEFNKVLGQTKRGTERGSRKAIEQYYDKKLDEAIDETFSIFFEKH